MLLLLDIIGDNSCKYRLEDRNHAWNYFEISAASFQSGRYVFPDVKINFITTIYQIGNVAKMHHVIKIVGYIYTRNTTYFVESLIRARVV